MTGATHGRIFVFTDFDGTITATESLEAVFRKFLPGRWEPVKEELRAGRTTLREGVSGLIESIPSARYPEVLRFVSEMPIRGGFDDFLSFLEEREIPLIIVSGGIRGMVEVKLRDYLHRLHAIIAVDVDTNGAFLKVDHRYAGETELVDKRRVIDGFNADTRVVIGDGITDYNMAQHAELVFARQPLAGFLEGLGIAYRNWEDFLDVKSQMEKWLVSESNIIG